MNRYLTLVCIWMVISIHCSPKKQNQMLMTSEIKLFENSRVWKLAKAVEKQDIKEIKEIAKADSTLLNYQEPKYGITLLHWSVNANKLSAVTALAECGANPNIQNYAGISAFIEACNNLETSDYCKVLLKYGGDVNAISKAKGIEDNRTPLAAASLSYDLARVKLLVEAGANIDYHSERGECALRSACINESMEILKYLIVDKGADFKTSIGFWGDGSPAYVVDWLRLMDFPLDSEKHRFKMEIVEYMKSKGVDYWKAPIPKGLLDEYDSVYLEKY